MPASIVLELQQLASNSQGSVTELLRKALIVATKLKINDFKKWIEDELNGYADSDSEIPSYRHTTCEIKAYNPYNGRWILCQFEDAEFERKLSRARVQNRIAELEEMAKHEGRGLKIDFPPSIVQKLNQMSGEHEMPPSKIVPSNVVTGIISTVRTTILKWALKLEEEGILGEGMTFSDSEKEKAAQAPSVHIGSFQGVLGNVSAHNLQIGDYSGIHQQLKAQGISQADRNELENLMDELPKAPPEKRPGLIQRGMDWIGRNEKSLGAIASTIRKFFQ